MDLVGEHAEAAWKSVNLSPSEAKLSMFGVSISPPKAEMSENPRSSATITRKFGFECMFAVEEANVSDTLRNLSSRCQG